MDADKILALLTERQGVLSCLANDGRIHYADLRLSVFRSNSDFAVFVEMVHHWISDDYFLCMLGGISSCSDNPIREFLELPIAEVADAPLWKYGENDTDPWVTWLADRAGFSVIVEGVRYDFMPTLEDYQAAGITFEQEKVGEGTLEPGVFLRFLCYHLKHPFFASENDLLSQFPDCQNMERFIQTQDWHHRVYDVNEFSDKKSSSEDYLANNPCFQVLARAIESGDLTEWNQQNPDTFNTHWESLEAIRKE